MADTPPLPPDTIAVPDHAQVRAGALPTEMRADGTLVIDLLPLAPPPPRECIAEEPDPLNPEIIVCRQTAPSPRIGPDVLPDVDDFGIGIPRARFRLSDTAAVELNGTNPNVGGFNAQGGEVRLKIDF
ncbi:hypothetical protein [Erythrobacter dokdonensis]|uniref:Uncharacterized protein n=1 Tax=Erythrobacter dokdonensis DSW-74 TaxID=1300349 RepID=A0A1A7BGF6_9SPHN|nr:hypothetical protein [Erythrobacter dokdonensis]OBV11574.1 hypothetical protein I603_1017 [Erythrobacter dokdonensis DSW-74]